MRVCWALVRLASDQSNVVSDPQNPTDTQILDFIQQYCREEDWRKRPPFFGFYVSQPDGSKGPDIRGAVTELMKHAKSKTK